jgi:hypothetical protein
VGTKIKDLIPDDRNANKGTQRGTAMLEDSIRESGLGRSILIDKHNRIIAGNKTSEIAGSLGIEDVQIVESDGKKIIAVKRTDIDLDTPQGRKLALFDNRTSQLNLDWDSDVLKGLSEDIDLSTLWNENEMNVLHSDVNVLTSEWDSALNALPYGDKSPFQQMTFTLSDAQAEAVKDAIAKAKGAGDFVATGNENSNGNALWRVCDAYLHS